MKKVPIKLERDPILEAVFELRFQAEVPSISDLLPGLLYPKLKDRFKTPERLPGAGIPKEILEFNPSLLYQPRIRLMSDQCSIYVGDKSLVVSCTKPYLGWSEFKPLLLDVLQQLQKTDLISTIERFSLKYVNVLEAKELKDQFNFIRLSAQLGSYDLTNYLISVISEIKADGLVNLIEIKSGTTATTTAKPQGVAVGLYLSIDTIYMTPEAFWDKSEQHLEKVHSKEKQIFFDLLTEETTKNLGAVW